jgi:uncharacterized protein YecE (DUF72 family)
MAGESLTDYLVGTGGWAYFTVAGKSSLRAYSRVFNFVEVNYTFYEYPETRTVERWRRIVPKGFTFGVRCHQDLTHRIGLKPIDEAFYVLGRAVSYCVILGAPFLILETPTSYKLDAHRLQDTRDFFQSANLKGIRLVGEVRAPLTTEAANLMRDFDVVQCVDLSRETPKVMSDIVYSRLFGKGQQNIYQFTDEELVDIAEKANKLDAKVVALSYHGVRMNSDAARFLSYRKTGQFMPVTSFTGADSVRAVLLEDTRFPSSKSELIEQQGWKVVDVTLEKRVHLSELLVKLPEGFFGNVNDVVQGLEAIW